MNEYFTYNEVSPGLFHIYEPVGVCCSLIVGNTSAILIDSGYGMKNIREFVESLTDLPITLVNTHCHLDHSGGNYFWGEAFVHPFEEVVYDQYRQPEEKFSLLKLRPTPRDLDLEEYLTYKPCRLKPLTNHQIFDLGGRNVETIFLPGHTKGSVVFYDHQTGTLMSGDEISNSVWIMFNVSASLDEFEEGLVSLAKDFKIKQILASHVKEPLPHRIMDYVLKAVRNRNPETSTVFIHPRHGYKALRHKELVDDISGIKAIYLVYPI